MTDELRVARDVMDGIREDLSWVSRNGVPSHREGHTQLRSMARDPLAANANECLEVCLTNREAAESTALLPGKFDELVSEIAEIVTVVGQEQLNLLLTALDSAREKLLVSIKTPANDPKPQAKSTTSEHRSQSTTPANPTGPGHLF